MCIYWVIWFSSISYVILFYFSILIRRESIANQLNIQIHTHWNRTQSNWMIFEVFFFSLLQSIRIHLVQNRQNKIVYSFEMLFSISSNDDHHVAAQLRVRYCNAKLELLFNWFCALACDSSIHSTWTQLSIVAVSKVNRKQSNKGSILRYCSLKWKTVQSCISKSKRKTANQTVWKICNEEI